MSTIKIEFPADRPDIAKILGESLIAISNLSGTAVPGVAAAADNSEKSDDTVEASAITSQDAGSDGHGQFNQNEIDEQNNLVDPAVTDTKGVPFNAEFCGKAAKPYYASGKRAGQWKKRQGIDEMIYDEWYAGELAKFADNSIGQNAVDTGAAFNNQQHNQQQQGNDANAPAAPHDAGTLMAWVSEMQTAGLITQQQVNDAYQQAGVTMTDVFPGPNKTVETIAQNVRAVHTILASWIQT